MIAAARAFLFAVFAAATVATFAIFVAGWLLEGQPAPQLNKNDLAMLIVVFMHGIVLGTLAMVFVCLPLTAASAAFGLEGAWIYRGFGFVTGCAAYTFFSGLPAGAEVWLLMAIIGGLPGVVAGQVWWQSYRKSGLAT